MRIIQLTSKFCYHVEKSPCSAHNILSIVLNLFKEDSPVVHAFLDYVDRSPLMFSTSIGMYRKRIPTAVRMLDFRQNYPNIPRSVTSCRNAEWPPESNGSLPPPLHDVTIYSMSSTSVNFSEIEVDTSSIHQFDRSSLQVIIVCSGECTTMDFTLTTSPFSHYSDKAQCYKG